MNKKRFFDVQWYCDNCNESLDSQIGFNDYNDTWKCTNCGHINQISEDEIYDSFDDYLDQNNISYEPDENSNNQRMFHMFSAKRIGYDTIYYYFAFPSDKYTEYEARNQFVEVKRYTYKNNYKVEYTAYEYRGDTYYEILYDGLYSEKELIDRGYSKFELDIM